MIRLDQWDHTCAVQLLNQAARLWLWAMAMANANHIGNTDGYAPASSPQTHLSAQFLRFNFAIITISFWFPIRSTILKTSYKLCILFCFEAVTIVLQNRMLIAFWTQLFCRMEKQLASASALHLANKVNNTWLYSTVQNYIGTRKLRSNYCSSNRNCQLNIETANHLHRSY